MPRERGGVCCDDHKADFYKLGVPEPTATQRVRVSPFASPRP